MGFSINFNSVCVCFGFSTAFDKSFCLVFLLIGYQYTPENKTERVRPKQISFSFAFFEYFEPKLPFTLGVKYVHRRELTEEKNRNK